MTYYNHYFRGASTKNPQPILPTKDWFVGMVFDIKIVKNERSKK